MSVTQPEVEKRTIPRDVTQEDPAPDPRPHEDPKPGPVAPNPDESQKRSTCAQDFPNTIRCNDLPSSYRYRSEEDALDQIKLESGEGGARFHSRGAPATGGPCPVGGWSFPPGRHTNVRVGGNQLASIVSCPCCSDARGQAMLESRCAIVNRRYDVPDYLVDPY